MRDVFISRSELKGFDTKFNMIINFFRIKGLFPWNIVFRSLVSLSSSKY
jgi:hypothetical protein